MMMHTHIWQPSAHGIKPPRCGVNQLSRITIYTLIFPHSLPLKPLPPTEVRTVICAPVHPRGTIPFLNGSLAIPALQRYRRATKISHLFLISGISFPRLVPIDPRPRSLFGFPHLIPCEAKATFFRVGFVARVLGLLGLLLLLGKEEGSLNQGTSKEAAMSGGSGSFLEIQPSELAFPCKSSQASHPDRVVVRVGKLL